MMSSRKPSESRQDGNRRSKKSRGLKRHPLTSAPSFSGSQQKDAREPVWPNGVLKNGSVGARSL